MYWLLNEYVLQWTASIILIFGNGKLYIWWFRRLLSWWKFLHIWQNWSWFGQQNSKANEIFLFLPSNRKRTLLVSNVHNLSLRQRIRLHLLWKHRRIYWPIKHHLARIETFLLLETLRLRISAKLRRQNNRGSGVHCVFKLKRHHHSNGLF